MILIFNIILLVLVGNCLICNGNQSGTFGPRCDCSFPTTQYIIIDKNDYGLQLHLREGENFILTKCDGCEVSGQFVPWDIFVKTTYLV